MCPGKSVEGMGELRDQTESLCRQARRCEQA